MGFRINSLYLSDGYKVGHKSMLAPGTTRLYGTWIPRSTKHAPKGITKIVSFGQQLVWKWLHDEFEENFFMNNYRTNPFTKEKMEVPGLKEKALQFIKDMSLYLGMEYDGKHFEELWDLGYLPIKVKALPEGIETNPNIPHMTFVNTVDGFAWLTLYLETIVSALAWKPSTAATIAKLYRRQAEEWVKKTDPSNLGLVDFMCHDFSARGLDPMSQYLIGLGHATSFKGSDTLPVIPAARYFYGVKEDEMPIFSVNASEHSVSTTKIFTVGEQQMIGDWLKIFPKGILSIVSDTFDLWKLITEYLPANKEAIMARDGKLVIRPDCYSEDTLFLTNYGWKNIDAIKQGALVAQVEEDGSYTFVQPSKIVDEPYEGEMYKYTDFHGKMDLLVTPNHRMVYKQFNNWKVDYAENCKPNNYTKQFIRGAKAVNKNRKLSFIERLNIAFQADGSYQTGVTSSIRFSFSKIRKIHRLENLLKENNIEYTTYNLGDGKVEFNIKIDKSEVNKDFNWVNTNDLCSNWCQEFIEELSHWDSSIRNEGRIKFDTTNTAVISTVELIALSAGYGCLISEYEDERSELFSKVYTANILLDNKLGGQSIQVEKINYKGNIVCVTVPTGRIVVKRNRCTMVCGNSGDPVDIICGVGTKYEDLSKWFPDGEILPEYFEDSLLEEVREDTPHGERGASEHENIYIVRGKLYKAKIHNISWDRYDKQYYYIDMWEKVKITIEELPWKPSDKGVIELLWDIFGGTVNEQGYKVLDPHIGAIYGDSITPERQVQIYERLAAKGFAATNIVLGIGSFTYQYNTRDTLGFAAKGAWFEVKDTGKCNCGHTIECDCVKEYNIYKDPVTDDGVKRSLKGLLQVKLVDNEYIVNQECSWEQEEDSELKTIYENGKFYNETSLTEIRKKLNEH